MSKILELTTTTGLKVGIPIRKITGIMETNKNTNHHGKCYIATRADNADDNNGWYVSEDYKTVKSMFEHCLNMENSNMPFDEAPKGKCYYCIFCKNKLKKMTVWICNSCDFTL